MKPKFKAGDIVQYIGSPGYLHGDEYTTESGELYVIEDLDQWPEHVFAVPLDPKKVELMKKSNTISFGFYEKDLMPAPNTAKILYDK